MSVERKHVSVPSLRGYQGYSFESVITGNKTEMLSEAEQSSDEKNVPITMSEREENTEDMLVRTVSIESNDADVITIMEDMEIVWAEGVSLRVPAGATVENGITIRMGEQGGQTIYPNGYTEIYPAGYAIELVNLSGDNVSVIDTVSDSLLESSGCSISNVGLLGLIPLFLLWMRSVSVKHNYYRTDTIK